MFGDLHPQERRDAGVLLLHAGHPAQVRRSLPLGGLVKHAHRLQQMFSKLP